MFSLFKKRPDRELTSAPQQPDVIYLSSGHGVAVVKWDGTIAAKEAMAHPIVFRALDKIASSVQQVNWEIINKSDLRSAATAGKRTKISRHGQRLQDFLDYPHDDMTPSMVRYWMGLNYALHGYVPYKVGMSAVYPDTPNGLYPLNVPYTNVVTNSRAQPTSYVYGSGEGKQTYPSRHTAKPGQAFVDAIWKPGLKGYQSVDDANTPMKSCALPANVVKALLVRSIKTALGHPNVRYIVTCSKALNSKQLDTLRNHLNQEMSTDGELSGSVPVLQNAADVQIHKLDNDLSDIHSKTPVEDMSRMIFGSFGIPPAVAGMTGADAAKFANNYSESRLTFWEDTIIPMYVRPIFQGLTRSLCPPELVVRANFEDIPALTVGRYARMEVMSKVTFLTATEKREAFGYAETTEELHGEAKQPTATINPATPTEGK